MLTSLHLRPTKMYLKTNLQTVVHLKTNLQTVKYLYQEGPQESASHQTVMVLRLDSIEERKNCIVFGTVILCTIVTVVNKTNEYLKVVL